MRGVVVHFWAFLGISVLLIVAPGPDTVLVTKNAVLHGRRAALGSALGVNTGLVIWTLGAAVGVAALIRESAIAFTVLKLVGGCYLIWLGLQALRAAQRQVSSHISRSALPRGELGALSGFRQGLLSDLANPKIGVFFTSLLPQFVSSRGPVLASFLLLGGAFVLVTVVWLCGYAVVAAKAADLLSRRRVKAALDRLTGFVLIGLGVRVALERR
jgi:RhtB (resistance to homoserine/threonine) family protein